MKKFSILPSAAGIIALAATIGFVDGQRDLEEESFVTSRVTLVKHLAQATTTGDTPLNQLEAKANTPVYLVEIRHKDTLEQVKVDATSGNVLKS